MYEVHELDDLLVFTEHLCLYDEYNWLCEASAKLPGVRVNQLAREAFTAVLNGNSNKNINTIYKLTIEQLLILLHKESEQYT